MWVTLVTLCVVTTVYARPEPIRPEEALYRQASELQALQEYLEPQQLQPSELNRKKKQVTTFCVEIRPSDHKAFQICEPSQSKGGYNHANQGYYSVPNNYVGVDQVKPQESIHSGTETQSKPAYSNPVKTYASSGDSGGSASKQTYTNYRPNYPEVQNVGPARSAISENEETPSAPITAETGAAKSVNEDIKYDVPTMSRSSFNEKMEQPKEEESPSARSAAISESVPALVEIAEKPIAEIIDAPSNGHPNDASTSVKTVVDSSPSLNAASDVSTSVKAVDESVGESMKDSVGSVEDNPSKMRAAAYHSDTYGHGSDYGNPTHYIPVSPVHNSHHSGLVITCQPNLAGYAHGVPGSYHHGGHHGGPGGHPNYNYRSAIGPYGRQYQYKPQMPYGGYKQYPVYKPQAQLYKGPVYPQPINYKYPPPPHKPIESYKPPVENHYPPMYKPIEKPVDHYPPMYKPIEKPVESWKPSLESQQTFGPPQPQYPPTEYSQPGPPPAYQPPSEYYPSAGPPKSAYAQNPYYKPAYGEGYGRSSENEQTPMENPDKEEYTLKKMEDISLQRLGDSWTPEGMEEVLGETEKIASGAKEDFSTNSKYDSKKIEESMRNAEEEIASLGGGWREALEVDSPNNQKGEYKETHGRGGYKEHHEGYRNAQEDYDPEVGSSLGGGWREAQEEQQPEVGIPYGGGWREAQESQHSVVGSPQGGGWREAQEEQHPEVGIPYGGGWREAQESQHSVVGSPQGGGWREALEGGGWREAQEEFYNDGSNMDGPSLGMIENESKENKIDDN